MTKSFALSEPFQSGLGLQFPIASVRLRWGSFPAYLSPVSFRARLDGDLLLSDDSTHKWVSCSTIDQGRARKGSSARW